MRISIGPAMSTPDTIAAIDRVRAVDEIARQHELLSKDIWRRNLLIFCGYGFCALFADPWAMMSLALADIATEMLSLRLLRKLDPAASPGRYRTSIALIVVMTSCVATAAAMVWLVDNPYAKALAAGLGMVTLLQLSTVRSIHLPYGLAGMATVSTILLGTNVAHWIAKGDLVGMAVSTTAALAAITYAIMATLSNHAIHNASASALAEAKASDAAKSLFLAQMSHELRTPLNAIIGLGEVEAAAASGQSRDRLRTLVTSARGLAEVLDDVLDLSAINTGHLAITPRATGLRDSISATVAIFEPDAMRLGGGLEAIFLSGIPQHAFLDAQRLRQCLTNLIGNAVKYAGGSQIRVTVGHHDGRLEIDVSDTGPGVPPEVARILFEPFRRGATLQPGLGLGLAISRTLARQMGGDLTLIPSVTGAVFGLVIIAPEWIPPSVIQLPDLTGRRILVVDDIATNRLVAAAMLQALGAEVVEAEGGADALKLVAETRFDLVLLDIAMPGMDGFVTRSHLLHGAGRGVPVVAMTAGAMPEQRAAARAAGFDGFVAKPFLPETLGAVLGPLLARTSI
ncbi:BaeS Signal transduction histidine kinase [Paracoccaceae bacterium]